MTTQFDLAVYRVMPLFGDVREGVRLLCKVEFATVAYRSEVTNSR